MWRSLWRTVDRFSLPHFKYVIEELQAVKVISYLNRDSVIDLMQSVVEIVTYGDRYDPAIFECFMEYQVMAEFVRLLKIGRSSRIEAPLLQYLSIMIQNMQSEHAIYYCFSNDYVNSIIMHQYDFDGGDLLQYYISFLRAVSSRVNRDTLCLLVKVHKDAVVSFPLYTEALKFALHREKMIQTAVRALTLNIYSVSDELVYHYVTTPPNSEYFSDLVNRLRNQCFRLDARVQSRGEIRDEDTRRALNYEADKIIDDLYYLNDILSIGPSRLSSLINERLLCLLILPILFPMLQSSNNDEGAMSTVTSLYIISRILQVVDVKDVVNHVAGLVLYPFVSSSIKCDADVGKHSGITHTSSISHHLNGTEDSVESSTHRGLLYKYLELFSPVAPIDGLSLDGIQSKRCGLLFYISSGNPHLLLATLFLLIILAESKELDSTLAAIIGISCEDKTREASVSHFVDQSLFLGHRTEILNGLLKILTCQPPFPVTIQWHTGWFLRKLFRFQENKFTDANIGLFSTSYSQSCHLLRNELHGIWFDYIPDTFQKEWSKCASALEVPLQKKDIFFTLELEVDQGPPDGAEASFLSWRSMVNAVKVFVLHVQLRALFCKGDVVEHPLATLRGSMMNVSGKPPVLDFATTSFGSEYALGSAIPCKIAFSKVGMKDIYLIAASNGISGKLCLMDRHPLRSHRGIAFATAPLAGSSPKVDLNHPTWLHLRIREFEPKFNTPPRQRSQPSSSSDGRWTLGFPSSEACETARLYILEEIRNQRSAVESLLSPLLEETNFT